MNVARRVQIGALLALVVGGLGLATAGAVGAMTGMELPKGVDGVLATAGGLVGWLRIVVVGVLAFGVLSARE